VDGLVVPTVVESTRPTLIDRGPDRATEKANQNISEEILLYLELSLFF